VEQAFLKKSFFRSYTQQLNDSNNLFTYTYNYFNMDTIIRKANPSDAELLSNLGRQTFIESHGHSAAKEDIDTYINTAYNLEACQQELTDTNNVYYFIYYNNQPAGFSKIILNCPAPFIETTNITKLERIYVLKEFYNLKLGLALLNYNIELSKSNQQAGMWLYTWIENERAVSFYKKAGFVIIGSYDFRISARHTNPNHRMYLEYAE
jgi:ribosomal protein S18 acetylase RimI-like enzyme